MNKRGNYYLSLPRFAPTWLLVLPILNLLLLVNELTQWFIALAAITLLWQWGIKQKIMPPSKTWIKAIIALSGCTLLVVTGKSLGLLAAMLHLLCLSYILKPLEIKRRYDLYQWYLIGLLLLSCSLIYQQSVYFALLVVVIFIANLMFLLSLFNGSLTVKQQLQSASKLLVQALPLAILLFVVFPKIPPFWQVPQSKGVESGLNDNLKIGDISKLALSNELAFRAEFSNTVPSYQALYWRAIVLDTFDGTSWSKRYKALAFVKKFQQVPRQRLQNFAGNELIDYQVILTASHQSYLFLLDVGELQSANNSEDILTLNDYTLYSSRKVTRPYSYQVTSDLSQPLTMYKEQASSNNAYVEQSYNPKLFRYGQSLKKQYQDPQMIIDMVLQEYRLQGFRYTLEPPMIPDNSLDRFFYDTKAGFCEHYASSFTYIMRAAGIPARVVVGYLGGEFNAQGGYYSIFQRDAHAWSEVWIAGKGWVRVDPTAAVDPSRVEQGFSPQLLREREQLGEFDIGQWLKGNVLSMARQYLEMMDYQWTKFVINYSTEKQIKLLSSWFGKHDALKTALVLIVSFSLFIALFFLLRWYKLSQQRSLKLAQSLYAKALKLTEKIGIHRENSETDAAFINRIKMIDRQLAIEMATFIASYNNAVYSDNKQDVMMAKVKASFVALKRQINTFSKT